MLYKATLLFVYIKILKAGYKTHVQHIECNLIRAEIRSTVLCFY